MLGTELACSLDAATWAREKHNFQLDNWQIGVLRDTSPQILLNISRQLGKTLTIGLLAAWLATFRTGALILIVCPSLRQSCETFRVARSLVQIPFDTFSLTRLETETGSRIIALPSTEETLRGWSAVDLLIYDEASRIPDDTFTAMRPMLAVSGGREILSSTPAGPRGVFYREWRHGTGWKKYEAKAESCARIPKAFLQEEKRRLGPLLYSQEYAGSFVSDGASVFDADLVDRVFLRPLQGATA